MCEYDPKCSKADDPLAKALWAASHPVRMRVVCDTDSWCTLAKVYDLGEENGGYHLCQKFLPKTLTTDGWSSSLHGHWALDPVDSIVEEIQTGGVVHTEDAQCREHGNFTYEIGGLYNALHWGDLRDRNGIAILIAERSTRPLWRLTQERRGIE